jgi:hypothetical protein
LHWGLHLEIGNGGISNPMLGYSKLGWIDILKTICIKSQNGDFSEFI